MPSPVGHAMAGLAVGLAAAQPYDPRLSVLGRSLPWLPLLAATVAVLPDADLLVSIAPHFHRTATHSLAATAVLTIFAAVVTGKVTGKVWWRVALVLGAAHASHMLLDWLGTDPFDPSGVQVFWPFGRFHVSGWDVFPTTERRLFENPQALAINARALAAELTILGPPLMVSCLATRRRRNRGLISVPGAPRPPFV